MCLPVTKGVNHDKYFQIISILGTDRREGIFNRGTTLQMLKEITEVLGYHRVSLKLTDQTDVNK